MGVPGGFPDEALRNPGGILEDCLPLGIPWGSLSHSMVIPCGFLEDSDGKVSSGNVQGIRKESPKIFQAILNGPSSDFKESSRNLLGFLKDPFKESARFLQGIFKES